MPRTRGGAGSSSSRDKGKRKAQDEGNDLRNPYGIIFRNDMQKKRFEVLEKRKIVATRFIDFYAMSTLGFKDDILWMADRIDWKEFITLQHDTYPRITLEFLSSLSAEIVQDGKIKFRLMNEEYNMTLREFNGLFGFLGGGIRNIHKDFHDFQFWNEISIDPIPYDASRSKSSNIPNPIFRFMHRFMANTIFGRWDSVGVARQSELQFLWAMIHNVNIDTGAHLVKHLVKIGNSSTGVIVIGGLITRIATMLGCDLGVLEILKADTQLDVDTCVNMKMIEKREGQFYLIPKDNIRIPLPDPERTTIRDRANWLFSNAEPSTPVYRAYSPSVPGPSSSIPDPSHAVPEPPSSFPVDSSAGHSAWDFSEFRSSFDTIRAEHTAHKDFWEGYAHTSREHYQQVGQYLQRADQFHTRAEEFFQESRDFYQEQRRRWQQEDSHHDDPDP